LLEPVAPAQQAPPGQQAPLGQHAPEQQAPSAAPSGQQDCLAAVLVAVAVLAQQAPSGQQLPPGQQSAAQQAPSGQHAPSGQQDAWAVPEALAETALLEKAKASPTPITNNPTTSALN